MEEHTDEALARRLVANYSNQLLRVAYSILGGTADAQDVCQEVLLKRIECDKEFESEEHERAWLIRVMVNACKNVRRSPWRKRTVGLETVAEQTCEFLPEAGGVLEEVQRLPAKYREILVLYYYIGYNTNEIGEILGIRADAVRKRMARARQMIKQELEAQGYGAV